MNAVLPVTVLILVGTALAAHLAQGRRIRLLEDETAALRAATTPKAGLGEAGRDVPGVAMEFDAEGRAVALFTFEGGVDLSGLKTETRAQLGLILQVSNAAVAAGAPG